MGGRPEAVKVVMDPMNIACVWPTAASFNLCEFVRDNIVGVAAGRLAGMCGTLSTVVVWSPWK